MVKRERILAWLAFGTICIVWGTTYVAIAIGIETLPTLLFAGSRFAIAGAVLLAICALRGEAIPRDRRAWSHMALVGFLMVGIANVAVVWAEHYVSSGFAALLVATAPIWMAVLESLRRDGERVNLLKVAGMAIGFGGVALLIAPGLEAAEMNSMFLAGVVVLQLGSIAWNYGSIRSKYHPIAATPLVSAGMQMLTGGVMVSILGFATGEAGQFAFSARTLIAFLYLVFFGSVLAYGAYVYALSKLPTSTVSLYAYINPLVAVFLGWALLSEPVGAQAIIAMLVIFAGVALVRAGRARPIPLSAPGARGVAVPVDTA
jgi:drug/metabolite transporter (DMT)-like permease